MQSIFSVVSLVLDLYLWVIIISAILSWLIAFNVVNTRSPFIMRANEFFYRLTEPVLRPIRRVVPVFGGIDISPVILILIIYFIQALIHNNILYPR